LPGRREGAADARSRSYLAAGACGSMVMHISFRQPAIGSATKG
jgi:hypothetical protein